MAVIYKLTFPPNLVCRFLLLLAHRIEDSNKLTRMFNKIVSWEGRITRNVGETTRSEWKEFISILKGSFESSCDIMNFFLCILFFWVLLKELYLEYTVDITLFKKECFYCYTNKLIFLYVIRK